MPRDPLIEALVAEVDQALIALQTARKIIADLQRSSQALSRAASREEHPAPLSVPASLRYSGMTVAEAAAVLKLSEEQVRRLLRTGALIGVQFGGRVGWRLSREYVHDVAAQWEAQRRGQAVARRAGLQVRPPGPPPRKRG
jgi:excisionase family DNA binding protein